MKDRFEEILEEAQEVCESDKEMIGYLAQQIVYLERRCANEGN